MFPTLETERLLLREINNKDVEGIFSSLSNDEVTRFYGQDSLRDIKEAEKIVDLFAKNYIEKRGIRWAIERKSDKGIIGTIGFHAWLSRHNRAEIGYEMHPEHWRKGYILEALHKIISYGFEELDLTRIGAVVFLENEASNKLLTKIGFQKEGILRDYMYQNGEPYDTYIYSLIKDDVHI